MDMQFVWVIGESSCRAWEDVQTCFYRAALKVELNLLGVVIRLWYFLSSAQIGFMASSINAESQIQGLVCSFIDQIYCDLTYIHL